MQRKKKEFMLKRPGFTKQRLFSLVLLTVHVSKDRVFEGDLSVTMIIKEKKTLRVLFCCYCSGYLKRKVAKEQKCVLEML